jgi:hypothetical protein
MTYKEQFVAEVKVNGKILRVRNDEVFLPFGSEYSLLLKNLNSKRASVKISIDGTDVLDGNALVVGPNQTAELEGFLKGSTGKNKFRFIQKTKEIQEHRGDKIDDGIIRIEFAYEENNPLFVYPDTKYYFHYESNPFEPVYRKGGQEWSYYNDTTSSMRGMNVNSISEAEYKVGFTQCSTPLSEEGITVKGSEINQRFNYTSLGRLETPSVIVIRLKGESQLGVQIERPLTVETKFQCKTCGRTSSSKNKFCPNCGTFLE